MSLQTAVCVPISAKGLRFNIIYHSFGIGCNHIQCLSEKTHLQELTSAIVSLALQCSTNSITPMATPPVAPLAAAAGFDEVRDVGTKRWGSEFISGSGSVVNIISSRQLGTVLHVVVKHGQVVGRY